MYCGHLKQSENEMNIEEKYKIREFIPADSRYPNFYIKTRNVQK